MNKFIKMVVLMLKVEPNTYNCIDIPFLNDIFKVRVEICQNDI